LTRPVRARKAAVNCIKRAIEICHLKGTPRVAVISDTPGFAKDIKQDISEFAEVIYFDHKKFSRSFDLEITGSEKVQYTLLKDPSLCLPQFLSAVY
jgi:hypothetical protein